MRALLSTLLLCANSFAASPIIFGARGGAGFNDTRTASIGGFGLTTPRYSYAIGPTVGARLPLGFSVEADALYNRQTMDLGRFAGITAGTHSDSWEFPVMVKYTAGSGAVAPIFGAGVSVRKINDFGSVPSYLLSGSTNSTGIGFVAGAGLRFQIGAADITPELRYTRWNGGGFVQSLIDNFYGNRNQAQVLVGITF